MRRTVSLLLAVTVGMVLADSAIVTLALPDIVRHLDASVTQVAWVLISFNLVLAVACVPVARLSSRIAPRLVAALGIAGFAATSWWCALAGSIEVLILARCLQAVGGAFALVGCLELLVALRGQRSGVRWWVSAGVIGTGLGPAVGGVLTQAISWQAIFEVQVPLALLAIPAALSVAAAPPPDRTVRHPVQWRPNLTLAMLSAAVNAALFLLVLLLVEGWRHEPAVAALTVSVVPLAALAAVPVSGWLRPSHAVSVASGCVLMAGGLVGLALLPSADLGWAIAPQVLVGLGLGLTMERLTDHAMAQWTPRPEHAAWTVAARHVGVVLGLVVLTPIFTADLQEAQQPAEQAITALLLDAPISAEGKISLAQALNDQLHDQQGKVPDLHPAFAAADLSDADRAAATALEPKLDAQLERAAGWAFHVSFLVGSMFAVVALLSLINPRFARRGAILHSARTATVSQPSGRPMGQP